MSNINHFVATGRVVEDSELRSTATGTGVLSFTIAINEDYTDKTGNKAQRTCFMPCTIFGNIAEPLSKMVKKGTLVAVDGRLRTNTWERDGKKNSRIEMTCNQVEVLAQAKPKDQSEPAENPQEQAEVAAPASDLASADIPF